MPGNTKQYTNALDRSIHKVVFEKWATIPNEVDALTTAKDAPKDAQASYTSSAMSSVGAMRYIPEGGAVTFDLPEEGHKKTVTPDKYGLGIQFTEEMRNDDLTGHVKKMGGTLAKRGVVKYHTEFFDLYNDGFATETAWDASYIFAEHTVLKAGGFGFGSTYTNYSSTGADLAETSLQAAFEYFSTTIDESGLPSYETPETLVVGTELNWDAGTLMKTMGLVGSADNDINTMSPENGMVSYKKHVSRYIDESSNQPWFLQAKKSDVDFNLWWVKRLKMKSSDDFYTDNYLVKATLRFYRFCLDPRGIYGSAGSA